VATLLSHLHLTLGEMIAMPISSNYVASLAPDDMRGRYMGVLGFSPNSEVAGGIR
jgi:hypothetical protein